VYTTPTELTFVIQPIVHYFFVRPPRNIHIMTFPPKAKKKTYS
jgi:hypothetical protein